MVMHNPPHPGEVVREEILYPLGLSVSKAARHLGISKQTLSKVLDGNSAVTPEIAYRLSLLFKPSAESWLRQQASFDLWNVRQHATDIRVMPVT